MVKITYRRGRYICRGDMYRVIQAKVLYKGHGTRDHIATLSLSETMSVLYFTFTF